MGHLYDYTFFEKLKITPSDHKILLTEPPSNPKENQVKMYNAMFEKVTITPITNHNVPLAVLCPTIFW
jgi:actin-related protein